MRLLILLLLLPLSAAAQPGANGGDGNIANLTPTQERVIIQELLNRQDSNLPSSEDLNIDLDQLNKYDEDYFENLPILRNRDIFDVIDIDEARSILDAHEQKQEQTQAARTGLAIDMLHLDPDQVLEITFRNGEVYSVEELEEKIRKQIKDKLNQ